VRPLEPAELGRLLDHLAGDLLGAFFEMVAATGLRRGEALALRWSDVNIDRGRLVVRQQLVQIAGHHAGPYCGQAHREMLFGSPKTASGDARIVELDGQTTGLLLEHRLRQDTERAQWGDAYADHGLVFAHEDGTPLYGDEVTKRFGELCDAAGVRRVRLHDLRHGRASLIWPRVSSWKDDPKRKAPQGAMVSNTPALHAGAAALEVCAILREDEPMGLRVGHAGVKGNDEVLNRLGTPHHIVGVDGRPGDIVGEELSKVASRLHGPEVVRDDAACLLLRRHSDPPSVALGLRTACRPPDQYARRSRTQLTIMSTRPSRTSVPR
jgi:hypothetical protein